MNIVDIVILILFVPAIIQGISKGFVQQAAALAALILSIWAAVRYYETVCALLSPWVHLSEGVLKVCSFALILIVVILVTHLIARLITKALHLVMLGWLNKLLGIVFSLVIALILIGILVVVMHTINVRFQLVTSPVFKDSVLYNAILNSAYTLFPALKDFLQETAPAAADAAETITASL